MKKRNYRTAVIWGETPTNYTTHEFKTPAELLAFWQGVNAADGWLGAHNVEDVLSDDWELEKMADNTGQPATELTKELRKVLSWVNNKSDKLPH